MIEVKNLIKYYGDKKAVDNVSFTVGDGEIVGFLGPNGAGKSTTMNILTGYLSYTAGSVKIDGHDILEEPTEAKKCIGYLPEQPPLYMDMTVWEYLSFVYDLKKIKGKDKKEHLLKILSEVGITEVKKRRIGNLSKGYKQRVGLAQALIGDPKVLILDEPTVGLDPNQIIDIRNVIRDLGKRHTVILSSHILPEVSAVCERVLIINKGRLTEDKSADDVKEASLGIIEITAAAEKDSVISAAANIENAGGITVVREDDDKTTVRIEVKNCSVSDFSKELFFAFAERKIPILSQTEIEKNLEDIFIEATKKKEDEE